MSRSNSQSQSQKCISNTSSTSTSNFTWIFNLTEMPSTDPRYLLLLRSLLLGLIGVVDTLTSQKEDLFSILWRKDIVLLDLKETYGDALYKPPRYKTEFRRFSSKDWESEWTKSRRKHHHHYNLEFSNSSANNGDIASIVDRALKNSQKVWGFHAHGDFWTGTMSIKAPDPELAIAKFETTLKKESHTNSTPKRKEEIKSFEGDSFFNSIESPFKSFTSTGRENSEIVNKQVDVSNILAPLDQELNKVPEIGQDDDKKRKLADFLDNDYYTSGSDTENSIELENVVARSRSKKYQKIKQELPTDSISSALPLPGLDDIGPKSESQQPDIALPEISSPRKSKPYPELDNESLFPRFSSQGFYSDDFPPPNLYLSSENAQTGLYTVENTQVYGEYAADGNFHPPPNLESLKTSYASSISMSKNRHRVSSLPPSSPQKLRKYSQAIVSDVILEEGPVATKRVLSSDTWRSAKIDTFSSATVTPDDSIPSSPTRRKSSISIQKQKVEIMSEFPVPSLSKVKSNVDKKDQELTLDQVKRAQEAKKKIEEELKRSRAKKRKRGLF